MSNNPFLNYKLDLFMGKKAPVELPAADWAIFMAWVQGVEDTSGVSFILAQIGEQVANMLYSPESLKAADTHFAEHHANVVDPFRTAQSPMTMQPLFPTPDDFKIPHYQGGTEVWVIQCMECGSQDEYNARWTAPLTCDHDGAREVIEIKIIPTKE